MLIDNEKSSLKLYEWLQKYTCEGKLDIVTGYFTIGALRFLSRHFNEKIEKFNLVLGDFVQTNDEQEEGLDLMNENLSAEGAFHISKTAKEAVAFLQQDKVMAKTLEPNFCHAKAFIFREKDNEQRDNYFITGSSNLTEAGMGIKQNMNAELNIADTGMAAQFNEIDNWFQRLWKSDKAKTQKTVVNPATGKEENKHFKTYLIDEITRIFRDYSPTEIYYKILFEMFRGDFDPESGDLEHQRQIGRLQNTVVYQKLYKFQQRGVHALIGMLKKYNGAILGDAVGLGKTWSALAVIKYYQMQGYTPVLLSPKKLQQNWEKFLEPGNIFEKDSFSYKIRFHTDLQDERWNRYTGSQKYDIKNFTDDNPKLLVIDESHNLRNDKSNRFQFLVNELLSKCKGELKVLMLSATPINNTLNDVRNQFRLITRGDDHGFNESLGIKNIDYVFRQATKRFNEWREQPNPKIGEFIKMLPAQFFRLTDAMLVARTRKMVQGMQNDLVFPKVAKPDNVFVTPTEIGNVESFSELFDHFPPHLSGYQPSKFINDDPKFKKSVLEDEKQRDRFLVKMMYILMVKRLESSWYAFHKTIIHIREHHQNALTRIKNYEKNKKDLTGVTADIDILLEDEEIAANLDNFTLGKKRVTKLSDIDKADNLDIFKKQLKEDINSLDLLIANLTQFQAKIQKEHESRELQNSADSKLQVLMEKIAEKRASGNNRNNQKVVIFTAYKDTGEYLFQELEKRGFDKMAFVSGQYSKTIYAEQTTAKYEPILQQFAPFTKLFNEFEWGYKPTKLFMEPDEQFYEWKQWVKEHDESTRKKLELPIDILIATDALSEGQNLQDSDMVINYDIHWNPVRVIQRMGRIDRLGSPNKTIYGINFWPSNNINTYLNLQDRIEQRMTAMKLAGSEVNHDFTDTFSAMARNDEFEQKQRERMLRQMEENLEDIEEETDTLGMDDFSLEKFRQLLFEEIEQRRAFYENMPQAVFSGFSKGKGNMQQPGLVLLLGTPARRPNHKKHQYKTFHLIYIDHNGNPILQNQKEVLEALTENKDQKRHVPAAIDKGEPAALDQLTVTLQNWLKSQTESTDEEGNKQMGNQTLDLLNKLKQGDSQAVARMKENKTIDEEFDPKNVDLITWMLVSD